MQTVPVVSALAGGLLGALIWGLIGTAFRVSLGKKEG